MTAAQTTTSEIQKLMYYLQEAGQPLRPGIAKGRYGPYAENLKPVPASPGRTLPERLRGPDS